MNFPSFGFQSASFEEERADIVQPLPMPGGSQENVETITVSFQLAQ